LPRAHVAHATETRCAVPRGGARVTDLSSACGRAHRGNLTFVDRKLARHGRRFDRRRLYPALDFYDIEGGRAIQASVNRSLGGCSTLGGLVTIATVVAKLVIDGKVLLHVVV
jgi:hypothetical protein